MEKIKIRYPGDFFPINLKEDIDYTILKSTGPTEKEINSEIKRMVKEIAKWVKKRRPGYKLAQSFWERGNIRITAFVFEIDKNGYELEIIVTKNYQSFNRHVCLDDERNSFFEEEDKSLWR